MTAADPSRDSGPSTSSSSSSTHPCSTWPPLARLHRRKEKLCRTDLPLRSAPGVWLLVGVAVVLVGMCVAVAGYASASSAPKPPGVGRGASHADRMKLAGPVVMGVGLFVFICSATLLYENRDSALLTPPRPVVVDEERPPPRRRERTHPGRGSWGSSVSLAPSLCGDRDDGDPGSRPPTPGVAPFSDAAGERGESPEDGEAHGGGGGAGETVVEVETDVEVEEEARLLTCVVHHQEPPGPSSSSLDAASRHSSEIDVNVRTLLTDPLP